MRRTTAAVLGVFCLVVWGYVFHSAAAIQAENKVQQATNRSKTVHRIVYFACGKYKFRVGDNGVKQIGIPKEAPNLWIIEYENGDRNMVFPSETVLVKEEMQNIIVPEIVLADGSSPE
jgi:hypothetical protein